MAVHARLQNDFTEDEKNHNLMTWLLYLFLGVERKNNEIMTGWVNFRWKDT